MPLVTPFRGRLVAADWAARVISPLHDVLSVEDRRALIAANPDSYLHVTSDPADVPGGDPERTDDGARLNFLAQQRLLDLGAFGSPVQGSCFVYRMVEGGVAHSGVVAQVAVEGFVDGRVLGHEAVQADRVAGLVRHFEAVPLRSELVSLVHRDDAGIAELVRSGRAEPAVLDVTDVSGVRQSVWETGAATTAALAERLGARPLYVADGHHRVAASVQRWERAGRPAGTSVLCVIYAEQEIRLHAFHRRVSGPVSGDTFRAALAAEFDVAPAAGPTLVAGELGLYVSGQWSRLVPRDSARVNRAGVAGLDVTMLDERVLGPLLGVGPGGPDLEFVPELREITVGEQECDADGGALFTLHAPTMDDLVSVAERGEVMSAKSTYVQPKPGTGIFLA